MTELVDTHCHIQITDYAVDPEIAIQSAKDAGVTRLICVGCTLADSQQAIEMATRHDKIWASIGLHPHEADRYIDDSHALQEFRGLAKRPKVVAVGEIGLDYFYTHSDKQSQIKLLRYQLEIAAEHELPVIFHVREAFDDFWSIYDEFKPKGVIHSFTAGQPEIDQILSRGLLIGLNGIMTFTKDQQQLAAISNIPLSHIVVETDAPFLTPTPYRGTICEPKHVATTAEFLSRLRNESLAEFSAATTSNAMAVFNLQ